MTGAKLSYAAEQVRRYDHDRFLTAIFAPPEVREYLLTLYAFNIEIAKTGEVVTEPLIGRIRLQWWRDALDGLYGGADIAHEVARPLGAAISASNLSRIAFERLIETRENDLDKIPPADFAALLVYAEGTSAPLVEMALRIVTAGELSQPAIEAARLVGAAWALTGLLRAVPFHARQRRLYLPEDRLASAGVGIDRLFELKPDPGLAIVVREVAETASGYLQTARASIRQMSRKTRSPLLLAELARFYLADLKRAEWNPFLLERRPARPLIAAHLALRALIGRY